MENPTSGTSRLRVRGSEWLGRAPCLEMTHDFDGLPLLEQSVEQAASNGWRADSSRLAARLGQGYLAADRAEHARVQANCALDLAVQQKGRGHQAWARRLLGDIASIHAPSDVDQAEAHYRKALLLAEELGMRDPLLPTVT
jgi:hypothetical protein